MKTSAFNIQRLSPGLDSDYSEGLAALLLACVNDGASVSFVLPFSKHESRAFWLEKVRPAIDAGHRVLLTANLDGEIVGSVQLDCDTPPNQPHRGEISKLLVHPDFRRRGIARALMIEIERQAANLGRSLLTLDTASDGAESLYASLGYQRAGVIPGYALEANGTDLEPTVIMYKTLSDCSVPA